MQPQLSEMEAVTPPPANEEEASVHPAASSQARSSEDVNRDIHFLRARLQRLRRFPRGLQQAVEISSTSESLPKELFNYLSCVLSDPWESLWREQSVAAWALGKAKLNAVQREQAAYMLCMILGKKRNSAVDRFISRFFVGGFRTLGFAATLSLIFTIGVLIFGDFDAGAFDGGLVGGILILTILLAPFGIPISMSLDGRRANRVRVAAATALGNLRVPETVGVLAKAAQEGNGPMNEAATSALRAVLPTLTADHYGQLSRETVPALCAIIDPLWSLPVPLNRGQKLALEVLGALEKVGDGRAVLAVRRVANLQRDWVMCGQYQEAQEAAKRILPTLLERQRQENEKKMLLRAGPAAPASEVLLRPTTAEFRTTAPELLLRPSTNDPNSL